MPEESTGVESEEFLYYANWTAGEEGYASIRHWIAEMTTEVKRDIEAEVGDE